MGTTIAKVYRSQQLLWTGEIALDSRDPEQDALDAMYAATGEDGYAEDYQVYLPSPTAADAAPLAATTSDRQCVGSVLDGDCDTTPAALRITLRKITPAGTSRLGRH